MGNIFFLRFSLLFFKHSDLIINFSVIECQPTQVVWSYLGIFWYTVVEMSTRSVCDTFITYDLLFVIRHGKFQYCHEHAHEKNVGLW